MPESYIPFSGADLPLTLAAINTRFQSVEDYFLAQLAGGATQLKVSFEAGESLGDRNAGYLNLSDNKIYKMDSDASGPKAGTVRGFVDGVTAMGATATLVIGGLMDGFSSLTIGAALYAGTTAGSVTQTRPAPSLEGSQLMIAELGFAAAADTVLVRPRPIQYQKRAALSDNETISISHHSDAAGYTRKPMAYYIESEAGTTLTSYASSNQDVGVDLRGPVGAGGTTTPDASGVAALVIGDASGTDYRAAQSFQITAGQLSQISLPLVANVGSPTGDITWKIHSDAAGIPGTTLASGTFTPVASSTNTINVSNGIYLAASTTYWVSFEAVSFQGTNNRWVGQYNASGAYANGVLKWDSHATVFPNTWAGGGGTHDMRVTITTAALVTNDKLAQGFQIAASANVGSVALWLKKVGSPTGNLTAKIYSNSGGNPDTVLGTSATVAASTLSTSYGAITFTFSTPVALTLTTQYHIVLETADSASNTNYVTWGADASSPGYSNGEMKREASSSWAAETKDAVFYVYGEPILHPTDVAVSWWSSAHADLVNRYGDGSGASLDTQTTFKCLLDDGFADITLVVELN